MTTEWKLVPVEPTEDMVAAGFDAVPSAHEGLIRARWRCMIAVAPQPPSQWPQPRPMSEAPKDAVVLAWWPLFRGWFKAQWDGRHWRNADGCSVANEPTHWLPIPPEPTKQEATE